MGKSSFGGTNTNQWQKLWQMVVPNKADIHVESMSGYSPSNTPLYAMKIGLRTECEVCFNNTKSIIKILVYIDRRD